MQPLFRFGCLPIPPRKTHPHGSKLFRSSGESRTERNAGAFAPAVNACRKRIPQAIRKLRIKVCFAEIPWGLNFKEHTNGVRRAKSCCGKAQCQEVTGNAHGANGSAQKRNCINADKYGLGQKTYQPKRKCAFDGSADLKPVSQKAWVQAFAKIGLHRGSGMLFFVFKFRKSVECVHCGKKNEPQLCLRLG